MPTFTYEALNNVGQPVKDEVEAASSEEAISKIRARGYFPTKLKEKAARRGVKPAAEGPAAAKRGARRTVGRVSKKLLTQVTRQLSTLIDAGLPILRSLRILEKQQKPGMLRVALRLVAEDVESGKTLSEAMEMHPKAFDRLYVNMVRAGELGGVLDVILQRLADFMEKSQALKRKVIGAMIYPAAVITFAIVIVTGLLMFVVPKFKEIFENMDAKLPPLTQALIDFSIWVKRGGFAVILGFPLVIYGLIRLVKMSPGGRYSLDRFKLKMPLLGVITSKSSVARFTRTLGTLLSAGVPILEALKITRDTSGNEVLSRALVEVHDGIREGESFAEPLRRARIVEPMVVNMIDVGEETGELDKMLMKIADTYDDEVETLIGSLTSLMEPAMIITLGVIVGFIVVALFIPLPALLDKLGGR
ncbi:MAG: type II secretion system F family protein [Planctomycetota bacterium]|jgi:type IV pilus assembly protein PilC